MKLYLCFTCVLASRAQNADAKVLLFLDIAKLLGTKRRYGHKKNSAIITYSGVFPIFPMALTIITII